MFKKKEWMKIVFGGIFLSNIYCSIYGTDDQEDRQQYFENSLPQVTIEIVDLVARDREELFRQVLGSETDTGRSPASD